MNEIKHYLVYLITNTVNGKIYVGQHQTYDVNDGYMGSGYALNAAYEKYGMDKFVKTILADFDDFDSMNNMESVIVDKEFVERKDTYNCSVGGTSGWQKCNDSLRRNPERDALRKLHAAEAVRIVCKTPEHGEKIHRALVHYWQDPNHHGNFLGKKHPEEVKAKMRAAHLGKKLGSENHRYGTHWWKDPNDKTKSMSIKEGDPVPEGWVRGRWNKMIFGRLAELANARDLNSRGGE